MLMQRRHCFAAASHRRRSTVAPGARLVLVALALAVIVLQTLGALHRVAHGSRLGVAGAASPSHEARRLAGPSMSRVEHAHTTTSAPWLARLFTGHHGHDCDNYDQSSHTDLLFEVAFHAPASPLPEAGVGFHSAWHVAAQASGFRARAPPAIA